MRNSTLLLYSYQPNCKMQKTFTCKNGNWSRNKEQSISLFPIFLTVDISLSVSRDIVYLRYIRLEYWRLHYQNIFNFSAPVYLTYLFLCLFSYNCFLLCTFTLLCLFSHIIYLISQYSDLDNRFSLFLYHKTKFLVHPFSEKRDNVTIFRTTRY